MAELVDVTYTESGTFTAPESGSYMLRVWGMGAYLTPPINYAIKAGCGGGYVLGLIRLYKGQQLSISIPPATSSSGNSVAIRDLLSDAYYVIIAQSTLYQNYNSAANSRDEYGALGSINVAPARVESPYIMQPDPPIITDLTGAFGGTGGPTPDGRASSGEQVVDGSFTPGRGYGYGIISQYGDADKEPGPRAVHIQTLRVDPEGEPPINAMPIRDIPIGEECTINIDGQPYEFIVVERERPSMLYDAVWDNTTALMMKDCYTTMPVGSNNSYSSSSIDTWLNGTLVPLFDAYTLSHMVQVKIPYRQGGGGGTTVVSGDSGLSVRAFLPSARELGLITSNTPEDGTAFEYFMSANNSTRVANYNDAPTSYWLRSPEVGGTSTTSQGYIWEDGTLAFQAASNTLGIRPIIILQNDTRVETNYTEIGDGMGFLDSAGLSRVMNTLKTKTDARYVPVTRTVNGKVLSSNITLTAADVGALTTATLPPETDPTVPAWAKASLPAAGLLKGGSTITAAAEGTDYVGISANDSGKALPERISSPIRMVTASTTLTLADAGRCILVNSTSARTVTIPLNANVAYPVGTEIEIMQQGTGAVTIAATSGVTIVCSATERTIKAQYDSVFIKQIATNTWQLSGMVG